MIDCALSFTEDCVVFCHFVAINVIVVTAMIGGVVNANNLDVEAKHLLPSTGSNADADAVGSAGGVLFGLDATNTQAKTTATVVAAIANNADIDVLNTVGVGGADGDETNGVTR